MKNIFTVIAALLLSMSAFSAEYKCTATVTTVAPASSVREPSTLKEVSDGLRFTELNSIVFTAEEIQGMLHIQILNKSNLRQNAKSIVPIPARTGDSFFLELEIEQSKPNLRLFAGLKCFQPVYNTSF